MISYLTDILRLNLVYFFIQYMFTYIFFSLLLYLDNTIFSAKLYLIVFE